MRSDQFPTAAGTPALDWPLAAAALDVGIVVHDEASRVLFANDAAHDLLRHPLLVGRNAFDADWDIIHPDGRRFALEELPAPVATRTGAPVRDVLMGVATPQGDRTWLIVSAVPTRGRDGIPLVIVTLRDVTRLWSRDGASAEGVAREARLYQSVLRAMAEGVAIHDATGAIIYNNPAAERILGLSAAQLHGVDAVDPRWQLVREDGRPLLPEEIPSEITRRTGHPCRAVPVGVRWGDRQQSWLLVSTEPVPGGEGLVVATFTDVTEQRRLVDAMHRAQRREAMGELAAGVAHNFNNMLAVVLPSIEMARADAVGAQAELLADASLAVRRAADLVRQLLYVARGITQPVPVGAVDLADIVRDVVQLCRRSFDAGIELDTRIAADACVVTGSAALLQQVVLNLLLNARDALEGRAAPRIDVRVDLEPANDAGSAGGVVCLVVEDNGCGMSAATQHRLGEPFFTTKGPGRGTGLGLATVFETVREAGGTLQVESAAGQGARFVVRLPQRLHDIGEHALAELTPAPAGTRVLLVDDDPLVRRAMRRLLQAHGLSVDECPDAESALAHITSCPSDVDVVIADRSMPGLSGDALVQELQRRHPSLPLLLLSGDVSDHAIPGVEAVQKPVLGEELLAAIRRALARQG
jgi:PAS domain S-box-containing protein